MTSAILAHIHVFAWLAQPRALLTIVVLILAIVDRALVIDDWLAVPAAATPASLRADGGWSMLVFPLVVGPALLAPRAR